MKLNKVNYLEQFCQQCANADDDNSPIERGIRVGMKYTLTNVFMLNDSDLVLKLTDNGRFTKDKAIQLVNDINKDSALYIVP